MTPEESRVLDHYEDPYHCHVPTKCCRFCFLVMGRAENEPCNDWIKCWIRISSEETKHIIGIWWEGGGCCFSQAAASMIAERFESVRLSDALTFTQDQMLDLFGVDVDPERVECVMVAFNAVMNALEKMPHD